MIQGARVQIVREATDLIGQRHRPGLQRAQLVLQIRGQQRDGSAGGWGWALRRSPRPEPFQLLLLAVPGLKNRGGFLIQLRNPGFLLLEFTLRCAQTPLNRGKVPRLNRILMVLHREQCNYARTYRQSRLGPCHYIHRSFHQG